jgi:hypothetical protein
MLAVLSIFLPLQAADAPSQADLQAAVRTLGFLDTLPKNAPVSVGVVFGAGTHEGVKAAQQTAAALTSMRWSGGAIRATAVSADELAQNAPHFSVLYLLPGLNGQGAAVADLVRRQHVISISGDPSCLEARYCVLMVRAGASVDIILDTSLADASGARFSSVFTMMVKRR